MSIGKITAKAMWTSAEFLDRTNFQLPAGRGKLQRLTPEQLRDGFERLQTLQRESNGWVVQREHLSNAPPAQVPGYELGELFGAFASLDRTLSRHANPTAVTADALAELRAGKLSGQKAQRLHKNALTDAYRLADPYQAREFQDAARAELARVHGEGAAEVTSRTVKPSLELADEHARRTAALEALLRLHSTGRAPASSEFLQASVEQFGRFARVSDLPALEGVMAQARKAGDDALFQACERAVARVKRLEHLTTAHVQLEGGAVKSGGIRAYVNPLTEKLAALGHNQDVYLPLTADVDIVQEGLVRVAGAKGEIVDALGERVGFELYKKEGPPAANGARRTFFYFADDKYFRPRSGVYDDALTGQAFPDEKERLLAGAALANASMSKVAAIRKLGGGEGLTAAQVSAAEKTLTAADAPQLIQYNDSHLAMSHPFLQHNDAFRDSAPLGIIHNGNPAYQNWLPREYVEGALESLGGRYAAALPPGEWPNMLELMSSTMRVSTVSDGYLQRMLHEPSEQLRMMASLQEAYAEGRLGAVRNGVDLAALDPAKPSKGLPGFGPDDLSGKQAWKRALQEESNLPVDESAPVLAFGNRIASQKGLDELLRVRGQGPGGAPITPLDTVLRESPKLQLVLGGPVAEQDLADRMLALQARWPNNVHVNLGYVDNEKLMKGGDVFLMPSREEPCGIAQMEAQARGTPVLATAVDGLTDTVLPWSPLTGEGTGFVAEPMDLDSLTHALREAVSWASRSPEAKARAQKNAMAFAQTFGADRWAENHVALMREAVTLAER